MSKTNVKAWNIAVVGAGTMGLSIAQLFATHGHKVNLYNRTPANLDKAMVQVKSNLKTMVDLETDILFLIPTKIAVAQHKSHAK